VLLQLCRSRPRSTRSRTARPCPRTPSRAHADAPVGIWLGVGKSRSLALTGRLGVGDPPLFWATPELVPEMQSGIDKAAAGRDPAEIWRVYNVDGAIKDMPTGELLRGPPERWIETLGTFEEDLGFDTFIFWPDVEPLEQLERFAEDVVPALRR
jgi:hypothetical protein